MSLIFLFLGVGPGVGVTYSVVLIYGVYSYLVINF